MARKEVTTLVDDIDGKPADVTTLFSVNNTDYVIDLSAKNYEQMQKALVPFLTYARPITVHRRRNGRAVKSKKVPEAHTKGGRFRSQEIRTWAKSQGINVRDRGRIPAHIVEQYRTRNDPPRAVFKPPNGEVKPGKQPGKGGKIARKRR